MLSGTECVGFQNLATHLPDTRNLTPETYLNCHRACLVSIHSNPIMLGMIYALGDCYL